MGLLQVEGLRVHGLEPVGLELAAGEVAVVRGASGSGKSLLLRAIADLDPGEGIVRFAGTERSKMPAAAWRRTVGMLAAEPGFWADTVAEHFLDWERQAERARALGLAWRVGDSGGGSASVGLDGAKPVEELSSGERQRVALLRALEREPAVLLLDEPTRSLDPDSARSVEEMILEWCAGERAVLWVTHDPAQAARLGGRVFTVGNGGVAVGPPDGGEVSP